MKCAGCGREELHKMCPAYGTIFYMSDIPYLPEIEKIVKMCQEVGVKDADQIIFDSLVVYRDAIVRQTINRCDKAKMFKGS